MQIFFCIAFKRLKQIPKRLLQNSHILFAKFILVGVERFSYPNGSIFRKCFSNELFL